MCSNLLAVKCRVSSWPIKLVYFFSSHAPIGCFIIQLPRRVLRVYWLGYLPGSPAREFRSKFPRVYGLKGVRGEWFQGLTGARLGAVFTPGSASEHSVWSMSCSSVKTATSLTGWAVGWWWWWWRFIKIFKNSTLVVKYMWIYTLNI